MTAAERRLGQRLPLVSPHVRDLVDLPQTLTGRRVGLITNAGPDPFTECVPSDEGWKFVYASDAGLWVKHPLRKIGGEDATHVHNWVDIMRALPAARAKHWPIQVSEHLHDLDDEWRVWVVNGETVTGCRYAEHGAEGVDTEDDVWDTNVPDHVADLAVEAVTALPDPPRSIVVDIARNFYDHPFVLEFNAAWSSDWYGADLDKVAYAIEQAWNPDHPTRWWSNVLEHFGRRTPPSTT